MRRRQAYPLQSPLLTEGKYELLRKCIPDSRKVKEQRQIVRLLAGGLLLMKMKNRKTRGVCSPPPILVFGSHN